MRARSISAHASGAGVALGIAMMALAGCDSGLLGTGRPHLPDPFDTVQNTNLDPRFPQQTDQPRPPPRRSPGQSFFGSEAPPETPKPEEREARAAASPAQLAAGGDGYQLNFENAAVTSVASIVLGDILGASYTIDPRVQGKVTIASGRPIPKSDLVLVLENALRMSNVVLVTDGARGYRLIPASDVQGNGTTRFGDNTEVGYGVSIVPLRYTSAQSILKLLDSFAIKAGMARADTGHNFILVQGSGPERKSAVETIESFDVDWMRGQSVGIYPIENGSPEIVIKELEKIMDNGDGGLNHDLVTLQPIARLNAVLVVTRKPQLLKTAASWISRLDKADNAGAAVRVYRLRYGDARQVAMVLGDLFGTRSSQGLDSAVNQIAPGAGLAAASSGAFGTSGLSGIGGQGGGGVPGIGSGLGGATGLGTGSALGGTGTSAGLGSTGGGLGSSGGGLGTSGGLGGSGSGFGTSAGGAGGLGGAASGPAGLFGQRGGFGGQQSNAIVLPGVRIAPDVVNNSLVIFANQENYRLIEKTLAQLDRPQLQVAIHATIAEVTLNNDLQFGVEYFLQGNNVTAGLNTSAAATAMAISAILPGGNFLLGAQSSPKIVINALRNLTDVKVLSSPSVVVLDNQLATLLVGDQVPVETQTATILTNPNTPLVNSVSYISTGVSLKVLPRVNTNGNVILDVEQEVSGVENNSNAASLTPTVSQRQVKSSIAVASGQTVLLGGLITETQQRSRSGIPMLEEIPALGNLFSTNDRSTTRTEIIIFIEPQIIRNSVDASKVAEELRKKMRGSPDSAFQPGPSLRGDPRFAQ